MTNESSCFTSIPIDMQSIKGFLSVSDLVQKKYTSLNAHLRMDCHVYSTNRHVYCLLNKQSIVSVYN